MSAHLLNLLNLLEKRIIKSVGKKALAVLWLIYDFDIFTAQTLSY